MAKHSNSGLRYFISLYFLNLSIWSDDYSLSTKWKYIIYITENQNKIQNLVQDHIGYFIIKYKNNFKFIAIVSKSLNILRQIPQCNDEANASKRNELSMRKRREKSCLMEIEVYN